MKKILIITLLFIGTLTANAQQQPGTFNGTYYLGYDGVHYDVSTRAIGALPTSNPSKDLYTANRDAYNQWVTYNTPDKWYREQQAAQAYYAQQQMVYASGVQQAPTYTTTAATTTTATTTTATTATNVPSFEAECHFLYQDTTTGVIDTVIIQGTVTQSGNLFKFNPERMRVSNGANVIWAAPTKNTFTMLTFCGGFVTNAKNQKTFYNISFWDCSNYPLLLADYIPKGDATLSPFSTVAQVKRR